MVLVVSRPARRNACNQRCRQSLRAAHRLQIRVSEGFDTGDGELWRGAETLYSQEIVAALLVGLMVVLDVDNHMIRSEGLRPPLAEFVGVGLQHCQASQ